MVAYLQIEELSFSYPDGQLALEGISLSVNKGERLAIVGPNGAGKTTLLLHLNGILRGSGKVSVDGMQLDDATITHIRRRVGLIFQDPNDQLFCPTVREDVAFGPLHFQMPRQEIEDRVRSALNMVDMTDAADRLTHHLSLGERRRVSIAGVLACDPEVLAFDEPSASLDPKRRRELIEFIKATDKTVLISTHDLDLALRTCGRCIIMNEGRVVADGDSEKLLLDEELLHKNDLEFPYRIKRDSLE